MTHDKDAGREWRPYEIATPIARDGAAGMPPPAPPGIERSPYAAPYATLADRTHDAGDVVLADRASRLLAQLVDLGMVIVPVLLFVFAGYRQFSRNMLGMHGLSTGAATAILIAVAMILGIAIWNIVLLVRYGQTVGKKVMKIRIVRSDGSPVSFWRILFMRSMAISLLSRACSLLHPLLGLAVSLGDVLMIFREDRRCLHDQIADTIVIDA
ncbi:RDD family protein [Lysobacter sp. TY2-98]|uniref:RDD family protein n=1 Tax=Lysobacter sp. TY2-98 TaxID=2290922 RepID=UPI000E1FBD48|nr:RDD family protein [Lysobacter sp. TY2-98]AXK73082.1 RDD family protein [Lysobacter sp. TY2-98]